MKSGNTWLRRILAVMKAHQLRKGAVPGSNR